MAVSTMRLLILFIAVFAAILSLPVLYFRFLFLLLLQTVNPGLQLGLGNTASEPLAFLPGSAAGQGLHVGAASADAAAAGGAEGNDRNPVKAVLLHKGIQDARLFAPPDRKSQIEGGVACKGNVLAADGRTYVFVILLLVERLLLSL